MIGLNGKVKKIIIVAIFLFSGGLCLTFLPREEPPAPIDSAAPSVELSESKLVGRKDGRRQWEILSRSVLQAGEFVTIREMDKITIFQAKEPHLNIMADVAVWERPTDILKLDGNAKVEEGEDFWLESDYLIWDGTNATLTSPGPVIMFWSGLHIQADQMIYKLESDLLHLQDNVVIRDDQLEWRLKQAVYNLNSDSIEFYGGLVLETKVGAGHESD